jgi:hypothetical protein
MGRICRHLALDAAVFAAGEDDEVEIGDADAKAAAPVDGVIDAVAHGEMQFHGGELRGGETFGEGWVQPGQKFFDGGV